MAQNEKRYRLPSNIEILNHFLDYGFLCWYFDQLKVFDYIFESKLFI